MQFGACRANEWDVGGIVALEDGSEVLTCKRNLLSARKPGVSASKCSVGASKLGLSASK